MLKKETDLTGSHNWVSNSLCNKQSVSYSWSYSVQVSSALESTPRLGNTFLLLLGDGLAKDKMIHPNTSSVLDICVQFSLNTE